MSEHNKAIARIEFEVWSSGELDRLEDRAFPDMQITIEDQVVESRRSMDTLGLLRGIGALPGA
jgi:hypothetical protein